MKPELGNEAAVYFRNELRHARTSVLRDAEASDEIIFALERMGKFLNPGGTGLGDYQGVLKGLAGRSPLAKKVPQSWPDLHIPFGRLLDSVREARNVAMHGGAFARHLASHAVKVALVLEDALMNGKNRVGHWMVQNPICAELWQPLSFIRQAMLESSFSFLPVLDTREKVPIWKLVSDVSVARYLQAPEDCAERKQRLVKSLEKSLEDGMKLLGDLKIYRVDQPVHDAMKDWNELPILITREGTADLLGILTTFDLL